ncbi:FtsX-like permease family protein [Zongyangia hominis]|uniref:FtsX-like permease family protein n=1 Tax=Zongyangia hominis TaxID=2763677 RepID=A0A926E9C8_9FIRM|nr:FtsX-like permease family protein [Zongyangia hominis]MBC8569722.1 FtsX-like permease family protein [Zongyangia hominis]
MMKRSALFKEMMREIWRSRNRFLSILGIIAIGTGFFSGVKASCPDMQLTAQDYFEENRLMDLHLVSTFGFNDDDIAAIAQMQGIRGMMPGYSTDVFVSTGENSDVIVHAMSLSRGQMGGDDENNIDRPLLIEGRLPEKSGECVVEQNIHTPKQFRLGNTIRLEAEKGKELSDTLKTDTYTIVGIVQTPRYINFQRGNTTIGDGVIDAFMMIPEEDFMTEVYTDVFLTLESTQGLSPFDDRYDRAVEKATEEYESLAKRRSQERYDEIYSEAKKKIADAKADLAEGECKQQEELADARKKIADGEQELLDGKQALRDARAKFNDKIADAERQIADGEKELLDGEKEYEEGLAKYKEGLKEYEEGRKEYEKQKEAALAQLKEYEDQASALRAQLEAGQAQIDGARTLVGGVSGISASFAQTSISDPSQFPPEVSGVIQNAGQLDAMLPEGTLPEGVTVSGMLTQYIILDPESAQKQQLKMQLDGLTSQMSEALDDQESQLAPGWEGLSQLEQGIEDGYRELADAKEKLDEAKAQLDDAKAELDAARKKLDDGWAELEESKRTLQEEKEKGERELADAQADIKQGEKDLAQARIDYNQGKADSDQELADAREKIQDAEYDLEDLSLPKWYVWDRNNNPGYSGYQEDTQKVDAIAAVFPVFFILVAALVCLTTMTRMVEEQRTQIGVMKALGYGRGAIMMKYVSYAILASVLGSALGLAVGMQLFPQIIINAYNILYNMPKPLTPFRWDYAFWCTLVAAACTGLSAFAACYKELMENPAALMRPKAPKAGKRVLLERWTFVWSKLSFTYKVTLRNIFRYKKRVLMTIVGVAGCTALILTGFGLQYAISSIGDRQFGDIFVYDGVAAVEAGDAEGGLDELRGYFDNTPELTGTLFTLQKSIDAQNGKKVKSVNLYVPESTGNISDYIVLRERIGQKPLTLTDEGVIINEKLGKLLGLGTGDTLTLNHPDGRPMEVKITGVTENYAMNYVYMTPALYEKEFREEPVYNAVYFNTSAQGDSAQSELSSHLMEQEGVQGVSYTSGSTIRFMDMLDSLGIIVWVLIFSAGTLAFIVLYNLTNININERIRELATIKVLGFYDKEVSAYIYRENTISALLGMVTGLGAGVLLERFVIKTAEVDMVMFAPDIGLWCFVYAALLTMLFALIVNLVVHFKLKKINMVESLKSVE